jgi:hypothetical protein
MCVLRVKAELYSKQNSNTALGGVYQSSCVVTMATLSKAKLPDLTQGKEWSGQRNPTPYFVSLLKRFLTSDSL